MHGQIKEIRNGATPEYVNLSRYRDVTSLVLSPAKRLSSTLMQGQVASLIHITCADAVICQAAVDAFDALNGQPFQDSEMQIRFIWDFPDIARGR
jgi:hypothetical protein